MPRAKLRTPELRDRVLRAAVAMLDEDGVAGFTTRKVAHEAATSVPAVYELFGDRAGLVREMYFEGFRRLLDRLDRLPRTDDPRADLAALFEVFRAFVLDHTVLAEVMFSRPFADFGPAPEDLRATGSVRETVVGCVRRCVDAGLLAGNPTDIAHVLLALAQGLAAQETAGWLGTSKGSRDRRWTLGIEAALNGLALAAKPQHQRRRPAAGVETDDQQSAGTGRAGAPGPRDDAPQRAASAWRDA